MKIKREDVAKFEKALRDIPFHPESEKGDLIVFPIDMTKVVDDSGFELTIKPTEKLGAAKDPEAMLILSNDDNDNSIGVIGFGDTTYGRKFILEDYIDLLGYKKTKAVRELFQYECILLNQEYIFARFRD